MLKNVKITTIDGYGRTSHIFIDGVEFPTVAAQFNLDMDNVNRLDVKTFVKKFEFDGQADLILNGVLIGLDNERRLYEQLKEKFEPKVVGELSIELKPTQNSIDRLTKRLLLEQSKRLEEKANEIGESEWISIQAPKPKGGSIVEILQNACIEKIADYEFPEFYDVVTNERLANVTHWRYKK